MGGSEGRKRRGVLLIAVGLVAVGSSLAGGLWFVAGLGGDATYGHTFTAAGDTRCTTTGAAAEQYRYGELSPAGQDVVDRGLADLGTPVETESPVPAFEYGSEVTPADPQYVAAHGDCYELEAVERGLGDQDVVVQAAVFAVFGLVALLGMVLAAVGTVR